MRRWTLLGLAGLLSSGCATSQGAAQAPVLGPDGEVQETAVMHRAARSGETVHPLDVNGDGHPDVWSYSVVATGESGAPYDRLTRKELDLNGDRRVDVAREYDAQGRLVREILDLDFDGKLDQVNHYDAKGQISRKDRDLDADGRFDLWLHYERGVLVRKERDVSGDGRPDYWEYWEREHVDRIGEDLDGDGQVDKWTQAPSEDEG